jgi:lipid II:glycine glycyltransferase (peptidoglycan interpeptide bridge formation enzyme)
LEIDDTEWDAYLQSSPLGHFQQSSFWAQAKLIDGWHPIRFILTMDGRLAGGFQMLVRTTCLGKIGYISKGPVIEPEDPALLEYFIGQVVAVANRHRIKALIVQPPDQSGLNGALLARHYFSENRLVDVISATLLIDLSGDLGDIEKRMRKTRLYEVRTARRRGIFIREGTEQDIGVFFSLMASTCARQRTTPVPATKAALMAIWAALYPHGAIRLSLAEFEGEPVAGLLCIRFGQRMTAWKKGWSGLHSDRFPNQLLTYEAIEWAHRMGNKLFDFAGVSRKIAVDMILGNPLKGSCESTRDWFNLGFGNKAQLIPESQIYIRNPLARFIYKGVGFVCGLGAPAQSKTPSVKIS